MSQQVKPSPRLMPVSTILTPGERQRVDAAGEGLYSTLHRESLDEVLADLRERRAGAVLISIAKYGLQSSARMAAMVREFPRVPAMALLTENHYSTPQNLLSLGQLGIRILIDARDRPAEIRKARGRNQADIARSDHADLHIKIPLAA